MTEREALNQALKALEINNQAWKHLADSGDAGFWEAEEQPFYELSVKAITSAKEALAQPEQEPVACATYKEVADTMNGLWAGTLVQKQIAEELENTRLYITSPHRTWVGLTQEEIEDSYNSDYKAQTRAIEAKLKEKNP